MSGILSLLNTTVTVKRPVADYDDMGGVKYTLSTISSDTLARISPANATEIKNGPIEYAEATTMIYTAALEICQMMAHQILKMLTVIFTY